jgi:hypothetical protein
VKNLSEEKEEIANIKKFFARQQAPLIPQNESNSKNIEML